MNPGMTTCAEGNQPGTVMNTRVPVVHDYATIDSTSPAPPMITAQYRLSVTAKEAAGAILARVAWTAETSTFDRPFQTGAEF